MPLTLQCGHGVCYQCVVSQRPNKKNVKKGSDLAIVCCQLCLDTTCIPLDCLRNITSTLDCYQLGLIQLEELSVSIAAENVSFKGIERVLD